MNPLDAIRERLEGCFIFCSFAAPKIRKELGVRHFSQVWTKLPSWYIWLYDTPGAFMLELRSGAYFDSGGISYEGAAGVIRYFPTSYHTDALSDEETSLLQSSSFDLTNTPIWDELAKICGSELFVVGTFELHCPVKGEDLFFLFEGSRRNLLENPGIQLFDRLIGMQAYTAQHTPNGPFTWGQSGRAATIGHEVSCEQFLHSYLASEKFSIATASDIAAHRWTTLASRTPIAAKGTGCGCCH